MRVLLPMQLKYNVTSIFIFSIIVVIYTLFRGAEADPYLYGMINLLLLVTSTTYLNFLKDEKFHRIIFTMPISTHDIIKTIYFSGVLCFVYVFALSLGLSMYLEYKYALEFVSWNIGIFCVALVAMGIRLHYYLRSDFDSDWAIDGFVIFGTFFIFGVPTMYLIETLSMNSYSYWIVVALAWGVSIFIYWHMYRKSVRMIKAFYIEVEEKLKQSEHHSIHSIQ